MNPRHPAISLRAAHRCEYCRAPEAIFNLNFEVEHIRPKSRDGTDDDDNLALACRACNLYKANHVSGDDSQTSVRLFHPSLDIWAEHFEADAETGVIRGIFPVGRATVARLQMNLAEQTTARRQWMRLGLFP